MRLISRSALLASVLSVLVVGCVTGDKKKSSSGKSSFKSSGGGSKNGGGSKSGGFVSANRTTLVHSHKNNPATSQTISSNRASQQVQKLPGSSNNKSTLEGRLSAQRLARAGLSSILDTAKSIAKIEMSKNAGRTIGDDVKLELALAAVNNRKYSMANYFLDELITSKDSKIKAGALNALGVIAMNDERVPEAVTYFKKALSANGSYKAARLNLGFAALKGGDVDIARKNLSSYSSDWFAAYGLISVARLEGNSGKVESLCNKVLGSKPNHKAALYNCALHYAQSKGNYSKARDLLNKAIKSNGAEAGWSPRIFATLDEVKKQAGNAKSAGPAKKTSAKGGKKSK